MTTHPWHADYPHPILRSTQGEPPPAPSPSLDERFIQSLYDAIVPPGGTPRCALMNGPERDRKYSDSPTGHTFTIADLRDHLRDPNTLGARTWAIVLRNAEGMAVAGCRDYDGEGGEGETLAIAAIVAATAAGYTAFATLVHGRGHVWLFFKKPVPAADSAHLLRTILPPGPGEIYPSGNNIRVPFGYHRWHQTRGVLVLPDLHRINLDTPGALTAAIPLVLNLRRNDAPPTAPAASAASATSAPTDPTCWDDLPDGDALMDTPRYRALFARRPQLRILAKGERVTLNTAAGPKDTGSEQVAVLIANLLTTGTADAPGRGAPPLTEIRAVALHWHEILRPGYPLAAYKADIDRLIAKYTPALYAPEPTRTLGIRHTSTPRPRTPAHCRRAGQRATQANALATLLSAKVGHVVTSADLARALTVSPRMIGLYLHDLRIAGRLDTTRAGHGLRITRIGEPCAAAAAAAVAARKSPRRRSAPPPSAPPPTGSEPIGNRTQADEATQGSTTPKNEVSPVMHGEHTAPPCVGGESDPASATAASVAPAAIESTPPPAYASVGEAKPRTASDGRVRLSLVAVLEVVCVALVVDSDRTHLTLSAELVGYGHLTAAWHALASVEDPTVRAAAQRDLLAGLDVETRAQLLAGTVPPVPVGARAMAKIASALVAVCGCSWARVKRAAWQHYGIGGRCGAERVAALKVAYADVVAPLRAERTRQTQMRQQAARAAFWAAERLRVAALPEWQVRAEMERYQDRIDRAAIAPPLPWDELTAEDQAALIDAVWGTNATRKQQVAQDRHEAKIAAHRKVRRTAPWARAQLRLLRCELQRRGLSIDPPAPRGGRCDDASGYYRFG